MSLIARLHEAMLAEDAAKQKLGETQRKLVDVVPVSGFAVGDRIGDAVVTQVNRNGRPLSVESPGVHTGFGSAAAFRWWLIDKLRRQEA